MSWQTILAIGSGGFLGAVLRAYLNGVIPKISDFPLPTLVVNLLGSFLMGVLFAYFYYSTFFSIHIKSFLTTGFLGALTTYSTFAFESFLLIEANHYWYASIYTGLNLFGTILMAAFGFKLIHYFH